MQLPLLAISAARRFREVNRAIPCLFPISVRDPLVRVPLVFSLSSYRAESGKAFVNRCIVVPVHGAGRQITYEFIHSPLIRHRLPCGPWEQPCGPAQRADWIDGGFLCLGFIETCQALKSTLMQRLNRLRLPSRA